MTQEDFLRSHGWRQFSHGYSEIIFRKDGWELPLLQAVELEEQKYGNTYRDTDIFIDKAITLWKPQPTFDICLSCGSQNYTSYTRGDIYLAPGDTVKTGCILECGDCKTIKPTVWRDANGDSIHYDDSRTGQFSYAIGEHLQGKKHFSNHLRKHDLVQKGTSRNTNDRRLKGH